MQSPSLALVVLVFASCGLLAACHSSPSAPIAPAAALTVTVSPPTVTATRFQTIALSLTAQDSMGTVVPPDSVRWNSADTTAVSVSAAGVIYTKAGTPGTIVRATAFRGRSQGTGIAIVTITSFPRR